MIETLARLLFPSSLTKKEEKRKFYTYANGMPCKYQSVYDGRLEAHLKVVKSNKYDSKTI